MRLIAPVPPDRRPTRVTLLLAGLTLYGVSDAMLVLAGLGLDPWDVLHQGLSRSLGLQVGTWAIVVGAVVLLGWVPLRQRPGLGTVCNVVVIGLVINLTMALVPAPRELPAQVAVLVAGVVLNGVATGAYIGAGLGPGPRDGLSTGIAARGHSVRVVRTVVEVSVLVVGWLLGGTVGVGTVLYALAIGPITHLTIPALRLTSAAGDRTPASPGFASGDGAAAAPVGAALPAQEALVDQVSPQHRPVVVEPAQDVVDLALRVAAPDLEGLRDVVEHHEPFRDLGRDVHDPALVVEESPQHLVALLQRLAE